MRHTGGMAGHSGTPPTRCRLSRNGGLVQRVQGAPSGHDVTVQGIGLRHHSDTSGELAQTVRELASPSQLISGCRSGIDVLVLPRHRHFFERLRHEFLPMRQPMESSRFDSTA